MLGTVLSGASREQRQTAELSKWQKHSVNSGRVSADQAGLGEKVRESVRDVGTAVSMLCAGLCEQTEV